MRCSIDESIYSFVSAASTARVAWLTLEKLYASSAQSRVIHLKGKLAKSVKGDRDILTFINDLKSTAAELALIGEPVKDIDLIVHCLRGLGEEYQAFAAAVRARGPGLTLEDLGDSLVEFEADIKARPQITVPTTFFSQGQKQGSSPQSRPHRGGASAQPYFAGSSPRGPPSPSRQLFSGPASPRENSSPMPRRPRPVCQYCEKPGHTVHQCFRLFPQARQAHLQTRPAQVHYSNAGSSIPQSTTGPSNPWLMDPAASHHVTGDLGNLSLYSDYTGPDELVVGNGSGLRISHIGSSNLSTGLHSLSLQDVLHVPSIKRHLISVAQLCRTNPVSVEFFATHFVVKDLRTGALMLRGENRGDVYELSPTTEPVCMALVTTRTTTQSWHSRLGHPYAQSLRSLLRSHSLPVSASSSLSHCDACLSNKSHKLPFGVSSLTSTRPFDLLYTDVWGPAPITSLDGFRFYLIIIDHYTRYTWYYPLCRKSDVSQVFLDFRSMVANYFSTTIRRLYTDGGGEFIKLCPELSSHGITHLLTPPHTPEHNGLAERKHRHPVETGITLLHHAKLPSSFWSYAFSTAVYLIYRMPSSALRGQIPYTLLFNQIPNYHKLRVFGCLCYPWLRPYAPNNLAPRSHPCIFLGYYPQRSAYKCFDSHTNRLFLSHHVHFVEDIFPGYSSPTAPAVPTPATWLFDATPPITFLPGARTTTPLLSPAPPGPDSPSPSAHSGAGSSSTSPGSTSATGPSSGPATTPPGPPPPQPVQPPPLARSHTMTTRAQHGIFKPKRLFIASAGSSSASASSSPPLEPTSVKEALLYPEWSAALTAENQALHDNETWDLVPRLPHYNVLGNRWVYCVKRQPDGSIARFKTRLVAKGFHQRPGIDFGDTYSPVVKPVTVRTVLTLALSHKWSIAHFDVNNAFLQGPLEDEVYMLQPPGYKDPDRPNHVCRLKRGIYGLWQAPRAWYKALSSFLLDFGFTKTISDSSLFVYKRDDALLYFLVYVDDLLLTGNNDQLLASFREALSHRFSLKSLGDISYFLDIEVIPTTDGYLLSQHNYMQDILTRFDMLDAAPTPTPMASTVTLSLTDDSPPSDSTRFRQIIGALQYLVYTRPDIAFSVNKLSQFMHSPSASHWQSLKRLLRYVTGTIHHGLIIHRSPQPLTLSAFADSDWASNLDDRSSTSAYLLYLGSTLVSWRSQKQRTVARSSTEAEYRAIAHASAEIEWLQNLLQELHHPLQAPPTLYSDNLGTTYFCSNPVFHSRMKHLALDYHFVSHLVQEGRLVIRYIPTTQQLVDVLTKPLPAARFLLLRSKIGVVDTTSVLRGRIRDI
ncbi:unnamed protein product [Linum trigynum]|uniref:Integrase catalytic domain-containing protein n=1 Tax=Linum trigynum TaxID=586398 RepID=A0AAV2D2M6_9ROSI